MVTAALRADSSDIAIYAKVLTESLGDSLPPGCVTVERARSMSDRMANRPGTVTKIAVRLGEKTMTLGVQRGAPVAEICHEVRGIVLSRTTVPIAQWAAELAKGAGRARRAERRGGDRAAPAGRGQLTLADPRQRHPPGASVRESELRQSSRAGGSRGISFARTLQPAASGT